MADYSSTLEAIRQQAQERLAQGISEEDLRAYGRNIGLTESEIDYVLSESQPKYQPQVFSGTSMSDLNKAIAADAYITKLATDLGDTNVSAGEQLALSDPEVRQLAENAFQRKNVDKISDTDLSSYAKALGLNQDLTDYLLGKEMNLGTDYDIGSNVDSAAATEQAKQAAIKATGKDPTKMTTADYLAAVLATPTGTGTGTSTVKGGTGTDTVTGGTGTKGSGFDTSEGYGGVKVQGESGLREGYTDYVQDYLERMSGLLARRNVDPKTGKPVYRGPQFGDTGVGGYGTDTLTNLKALQTQRENMMGMGTGAGATPMYTPSKFSFASPNTSLTAQGIKSLAKGSEQDKINFYKNYMQGADQTLRNAVNTYIGPQKQEDWDYLQTKGLAGFSQGGGVTSLMNDSYADGGFTGQTVPSTFTPPTGSYQQSTYTPGTMNYTAPGTYQAGTIGSTFDQNKAGAYTAPAVGKEIASAFTTPANIYSAGNIGSTFDQNKVGVYKTPTGTEEIKSTFTTPTNLYSAGNIGSTYDPVTESYKGPGTGISTDTFDAAAMQRLINPYTSGVVNPQLEEARRQAEITRQAQAARMAKAGAFGGSRQAIMESELNRNLATQLGTIYGTGQKEAYDAALRAFEAEQGRKLQASTATEAARQEAGRQGLSEAQTRAQLALQGQTAQEAARQAAGAQALSAAQTAGQLGLQAQTAQEAAKQAAGQQALSAAQTAAELGLRGQTAQEAAKQAAGQQALTAATTGAELSQRGQIAQEAAKQAAGQQAISAAQIAAQLGLQGSQLSEQSRQFAANYGLQSAQTAAQYDQAARQLQQQAEEAQARGDQFAATLALQQLQEAQRAAEATRGFEYQQARDTYLDPFREIMYASQALSGLPIAAGAAGDSSTLQALMAAIGLSGIVKPGT